MARLFVRLYLLMTAVLLATVAVDWYEETWFEHALPMRQTSANTAFAVIVHTLNRVPESQWPAEIDDIRRTVPQLQPLEHVDVLAKRMGNAFGDARRLRAGGLVFWQRDFFSYSFAQRIGTSDYAAEYDLTEPFPRTLVLWTNMTIVMLIIVGIAMWFWVRPLWRDLRRLGDATAVLSSGNFDPRVHLRKGAVLFPLAESFNWMAERVGTLLASHRALTNAVSHELRTPLARLRFAHTLAMDETDPAAKNKQLERMRRDMDELDALAGELLTLAKLERAIDGSVVGDEFPAKEWLEDRLEEARITAEATGRAVSLSGNASIDALSGNPQYLARAFDNIVNNAMRHATTRVAVDLVHEGDMTVITVDDDGPGIPEAERHRVFEPFVRLDASRDRASGGVGLGLAIVRQIARTHGGDCRVEDSPLKGARFTLSWPIHRRA